MKVRHYRSGTSTDMDAEQIVRHAVEISTNSDDQIVRAYERTDKLCEIVGRLVAKLPESEWLEVAGAWSLEAAK